MTPTELARQSVHLTPTSPGLTKREHIAALVLCAMCHPGPRDGDISKWKLTVIAEHAVKATDALLAELCNPVGGAS